METKFSIEDDIGEMKGNKKIKFSLTSNEILCYTSELLKK